LLADAVPVSVIFKFLNAIFSFSFFDKVNCYLSETAMRLHSFFEQTKRTDIKSTLSALVERYISTTIIRVPYMAKKARFLSNGWGYSEE